VCQAKTLRHVKVFGRMERKNPLKYLQNHHDDVIISRHIMYHIFLYGVGPRMMCPTEKSKRGNANDWTLLRDEHVA